MSNKTIFSALIGAGLTQEGACGLMGNMMAESMMKSNIAQRGMTNMSDEEYTYAADNGLIPFASDSVGYGYCQWTYGPRKASLLAHCKNRGKSVGDSDAQIEFCIRELQQDFPKVFLVLRTSHDINECSDRVCDQYEKPAVNNYDARRQYARQFFNEFCGSGALMQEHTAFYPEEAPAAPVAAPKPEAGIRAAVLVMQMCMSYAGYWGDVTGERSPEFFANLRQFTDDLEKV